MSLLGDYTPRLFEPIVLTQQRRTPGPRRTMLNDLCLWTTDTDGADRSGKRSNCKLLINVCFIYAYESFKYSW